MVKVEVVEGTDLEPTPRMKRIPAFVPSRLNPYVMIDVTERTDGNRVVSRHIDKTVSVRGNNPKWHYNNKFDLLVNRCTEITFRLFQEDIADDDWLAEGQIKICDVEIGKAQSFWLQLDPTGKLHIKIDLHRPMDPKEIEKQVIRERFDVDAAGATGPGASGVVVNRRKRKNAVRRKVHRRNGHKYMATYLKQPTFCAHCQKFIFGVFNKQGYQCQTCTQVIHKKCLSNIVTICAGDHRAEVVPELPNLKLSVKHSWKTKTYKRPTFCEHCGSLLWGLYNQGMQCRSCKMDVHRRCLRNVSNLCGVNPEELFKALENLPSASRPGSIRSEDELVGTSSSIRLDDFAMLRVLGKGSFGKVILVNHRQSKDVFAIKILKKCSIGKGDSGKSSPIERGVCHQNPEKVFNCRGGRCRVYPHRASCSRT